MATFEERLIGAVKEKREAQGLSIRALSAATGVSFSTLARLERGEGYPDNNSKIRLLEWLGPAAESEGLSFESVAFVHFRAGKNIRSGTVKMLLRAAECLRQAFAVETAWEPHHNAEDSASSVSVLLSKDELEEAAERFRADLGLAPGQALESLRVEVEGVQVIPVSRTDCVDSRTVDQLRGEAASEWSAMSVPLDPNNEKWAVLLNDSHTLERQRVTVLEEFWHILLGHKLTKIARVAEAFGRTYDTSEEHDAFYLAAASLLPKATMVEAVEKKWPSHQIASLFGTSPELVDYRIKRLGLWRDHVGKQVSLSS